MYDLGGTPDALGQRLVLSDWTGRYLTMYDEKTVELHWLSTRPVCGSSGHVDAIGEAMER